MTITQADLAEHQRKHWQTTYRTHPGMYGTEPSEAAVYAADTFKADQADRVLELAAGHGRDTLYFAHQGFTVLATDFSTVAVDQIQRSAEALGVCGRVV